MKFIDIEHVGETIHVKAPYRDSAIRRFRQLKGDFNRSLSRWVFRAEHIDLVREALRDHYGHDDQVDRTMDVQIEMAGEYCKGENEQWFGGRKILNRRYRDSQPQLGEEVILVKGRFDGRAGSTQYPSLGNVDGVVLRIRHVPADHPDLDGGIDTITGMEVIAEHDLAPLPGPDREPAAVTGLVAYPGTVRETEVQVRDSAVAEYDLCLRIDEAVQVDMTAEAAVDLAEKIRAHLRIG